MISFLLGVVAGVVVTVFYPSVTEYAASFFRDKNDDTDPYDPTL